MASLRMWSASLVALALAAVLPACTAPAAGSGTAAAQSPTTAAVVIHVADFMLDHPRLKIVGPTVTLEIINDGPTPHNVAVRDADGMVLMTTRDLSTGESQTISAELPPGNYVTFCSLPGHESLGVRGTLRVT